MLRVIPELCEQVGGSQYANDLWRNPEKGSWQQHQREIPDQVGNGLPEGAGQVKFFTTVVYHVLVPEYIDVMAETMVPVACKINGKEGNYPNKPGSPYMVNSKVVHQIGITHQNNSEAQGILDNIRKA